MKKADWRLRVFCVATAAMVLNASSAISADREIGPTKCSAHFYGLDPIERLATGVKSAPYNSSTDKLTGPIVKLIEGLPKDRKSLNLLVLSGGGQWGAYGAGFLKGWEEYDAKETHTSGHVRRDQIDLIFGISTGSMQSGLVYPALSADPAKRKAAAETLESQYTSSSVEKLFVDRGWGDLLIKHNSLKDPANLVKQVKNGIDTFYSEYVALPPAKRLYLGLVNLDRNQFFMVDVKGMIDDPALSDGEKKACVVESLLASAAIPLYVPPRFIDGQMYVDGGVRFGHFSTAVLNHKDILNALSQKGLGLNVSVIVNGNLDANSVAPAANKPVPNTFLGIVGAAIPNMLDQVYKDSNLRANAELKKHRNPRVRYTYVSNRTIQKSPVAACDAWRKRNEPETEETFNLPFMKCLYQIGYKRGISQTSAENPMDDASWFNEDQTPAVLVQPRSPQLVPVPKP